MARRRSYRVKEVSRLSGVTVRTLHHYDRIGLLVPSRRSEAGYRLYGADDLARLQQILIGRELGLPLEQVRRSLDDPGFDRRAALRAQRALLAERAERAAEMIRSIDRALAALDAKGHGGTMEDPKELFGGFDPAKHEAEAEARWGHTAAWAESKRRTKRYGREDWARLRDEQAAIYADAAALLRAGSPPESAEARAVAERHRLSIDRWFYPCAAAMHAGLADLWEADPRFAASIDAHGEGLTRWLAAAVRANAKAAGGPG